jgi:hypothetical protein
VFVVFVLLFGGLADAPIQFRLKVSNMPYHSSLVELIKLIKAGDLQGIQRLPGLTAAAKAIDQYGCTALRVAARQGKDSITTELLSAGANVNAVDSEGATPLYVAASARPAQCSCCWQQEQTRVNPAAGSRQHPYTKQLLMKTSASSTY